MRLREELERLAAAYRRGSTLALLFDYDGTLAPLVTHPALALCPASTLQLLASLADLPGVSVGIISGRSLADLQTMVSLPKLLYAGTSGLEVQTNGGVQVPPEAREYRPFLQSAAAVLAPLVSHYEGAWIEDKPLALTIHYRNVDRHNTPLLRQCLSDVLNRFTDVLTTVDGSMALEILPAIGRDKGRALRQIVEMLPAPALPLYIGNDANDAEALAAAAELGGISIGIGPFAPGAAQHRLPDHDSVIDLLSLLRALLRGTESGLSTAR